MKASRYLSSVRSALPENMRSHLDRAIAGDALAARRVMVNAPRRLRGHIACLAYQLKTRNPAYREIMKAVWRPEMRDLLTAFWTPLMVRRMLARAELPIPELSGPVRAFHPVLSAHARNASGGLCWSLSQEAAILDAEEAGAPRAKIVEMVVDAKEIVYWGKSRRGEPEIVVRHPSRGALVEASEMIRSSVAR